MEKTYSIKRNTIVDLLDDIEKFVLTIKQIHEDKPNLRYNYNIKIVPPAEDTEWSVVLTLSKHEQNN